MRSHLEIEFLRQSLRTDGKAQSVDALSSTVMEQRQVNSLGSELE